MTDEELLYKAITSGEANPAVMWIRGDSLLSCSDPITCDYDGNPIAPGECYMITSQGVFIHDPS